MTAQKHSDIAWGYWLKQFKQSPKLECLIKALLHPADLTSTVMVDLLKNRWLDEAEGQQLDGIGEIVGQPRHISDAFYVAFFGFEGQPNVQGFGQARIRRQHEKVIGGAMALSDVEYRKILYWKIAINNSHGTAPEIAHGIKVIFDTGTVRLKNLGNATLSVWFSVTDKTNPYLLQNVARWIPAAAGVRVVLSQSPDDKLFGFGSQGFYGFGVGTMAAQR